MNTQPTKYEVWTKNEVHYLLINGKAQMWSREREVIQNFHDRMAGRHLPMIPEFKSFLPVVWR